MSDRFLNTDKVDDLLDTLFLHEDVRVDLVSRLRGLVLAADPRICEEVKYGGILFSAGSPFCGVFSHPTHVMLEFSRGADLPDPDHLLEGDGKKRRHLKLTVPTDLKRKKVREFVLLALAATVSGSRGGDRRATQPVGEHLGRVRPQSRGR